MYRIFADNPSGVLKELAAFATRMADAERNHARIVYKGKKIETAKAEHCANQLDYLAETIATQMEVVLPGGLILPRQRRSGGRAKQRR